MLMPDAELGGKWTPFDVMASLKMLYAKGWDMNSDGDYIAY